MAQWRLTAWTSSTTAAGSAAGRPSPASARSRATSRRHSGRCSASRRRLTVAGRTDAGVHALGQVASFSTDRPVPESLRRALNSLTGPDLAVPVGDRGGGRLRRPPRRSLAPVPLPARHRLGAEPVRVPADAALAASLRHGARRGVRAAARRRPRLHGVHADRHEAPALRSHDRRRRMERESRRTSSPSRSRPTPSSAAWCVRSSGRSSRSRRHGDRSPTSSACSAAPGDRRPATR